MSCTHSLSDDIVRAAMQPRLTWCKKAAIVVAETMNALPKDADEIAAKAALYDAYPFGPREMYPYMVWQKECKKARDHRFRGISPNKRKRRIKTDAEADLPGLF